MAGSIREAGEGTHNPAVQHQRWMQDYGSNESSKCLQVKIAMEGVFFLSFILCLTSRNITMNQQQRN